MTAARPIKPYLIPPSARLVQLRERQLREMVATCQGQPITAVPISAGLAELWRTDPDAALAVADADLARFHHNRSAS